MMSVYEIAVRFWGAVAVFWIVLAVVGGQLDAAWRATRRTQTRAVRARASSVEVSAQYRRGLLDLHAPRGAQ